MTEFEIVVDQIRRDKERFIARLQAHLVEEPNSTLGTPCLLWQGCTNNCGYGKLTFRYNHPRRNEQIYVHRLFIILRQCAPIPKNKEVGHLCHTPNCVMHTKLITRKENMREMHGRKKENGSCPF